jgi:hypothetical protein
MKPMKYVLGVLALGCWAGFAGAADSPYSGAPRSPGAAAAAVMTTTAPPPGAEILPGDGGCTTCVDTCCGGCGGIHIYAGGGVGYIQPNFKRDPGFHVGIGSLATVVVNGEDFSLAFPNVDRDLNFAYDYEVSPRVWVGFTVGSGCGFRASWWNIDQNADKSIDLSRSFAGQVVRDGDTLIFADGSNVLAASNLRLNVYDVEFTYGTECCGSWLFSCGIRYAELKQQYDAGVQGTLVESVVDGDSLTLSHQELLSVHDTFRALGPTVSLEGRCPVCCGCLSVYGMVRGSILVGHGEENARRALQRSQTLNGVTSTFAADASTVTDRDDTITVGEFEVGLEAAKEMNGLYGFVRVGLACQTWWDLTVPNGSAIPDGNGQFGGFQILSTRQSGQNDNNLSFFGLVFTAGVRF